MGMNGQQRIATEDKLHNAETAAVLLGVRPSTIRWWRTTGKLPRVKIGRLTKVRESSLLALIEPEANARTGDNHA